MEGKLQTELEANARTGLKASSQTALKAGSQTEKLSQTDIKLNLLSPEFNLGRKLEKSFAWQDGGDIGRGQDKQEEQKKN